MTAYIQMFTKSSIILLFETKPTQHFKQQTGYAEVAGIWKGRGWRREGEGDGGGRGCGGSGGDSGSVSVGGCGHGDDDDEMLTVFMTSVNTYGRRWFAISAISSSESSSCNDSSVANTSLISAMLKSSNLLVELFAIFRLSGVVSSFESSAAVDLPCRYFFFVDFVLVSRPCSH